MRSETGQRFDAADSNLQRMVQRLDTMSTQVWSLRDDLPELLREALERHRREAS
jgi:hypothetical protein